jgi:hypothetical protein
VESEPAGNATRLRVYQSGAEDVGPRLCALAVECGWKLRELRPQQHTLEERFLRIVESETV